MSLSKEAQEEIIAKITAKVGALKPCSFCGGGPWELANAYTQVSLTDDLRSIVIGGQMIPAVVVNCRNCGNTVLLNMILLGLIPPEPSDG